MPSVLPYVVDILGSAFCPWQCFLSFIVLLTSLAQHFAFHYITDVSLALLVLHFVIYVLGTAIWPFFILLPLSLRPCFRSFMKELVRLEAHWRDCLISCCACWTMSGPVVSQSLQSHLIPCLGGTWTLSAELHILWDNSHIVKWISVLPQWSVLLLTCNRYLFLVVVVVFSFITELWGGFFITAVTE